jgi:hypothetical protein
MKYDTIKNPNYVATIIRVPALEDLEGLDNLRALKVFGMQALVGRDVQVGDVGVLFSTEVQLSEDFAKNNNLHRHSNLNVDPTKTGYLEDNRRVKAIKLRGHRSDSLFMGLEAFEYLGIKPSDFTVGDTFDSINGHEILRKYVVKEPSVNKGPVAKIRRVDLKVFPLHVDSENYWRNEHKIPQNAPIVVTQKLHGTSVRYGTVPVLREKPWYERLINKLGIPTQDHEYKFVVGSRMVVKSIDYDAESAGKEHFYAEDLWSRWAKDHKLDELIPDGYLVYGELVGWTPDGAPIQKGYTYDVPEPVKVAPGVVSNYAELYVYRVATVTPSGVVTDLSWPAVKAFVHGIGLKTVPELFTRLHKDFDADALMDKNYYAQLGWATLVYGENPHLYDVPVPLSDAKTVDEGVCVRYDGPNGIYILKAKSPIFLGHESRMLDEGGADLEAEEVSA